MLGKRYRLLKPVRAVYARDGRKGFVLLPEGALVVVDSEHDDQRIVRVAWESCDLLVFAEDLASRGEEEADRDSYRSRGA